MNVEQFFIYNVPVLSDWYLKHYIERSQRDVMVYSLSLDIEGYMEEHVTINLLNKNNIHILCCSPVSICDNYSKDKDIIILEII